METKDYGVSTQVHDGKFYDVLNTDMTDLPFYRRLCHEASGPILELCCGTGRLTLPLAREGFDVTGLDMEPAMLERARAKAAKEGIEVPLHRGDMRDFDLARRFDLIFIPFNSLQNTYGREDVERIFASIKRHLGPGGRFAFDVFNPDIRLMVDRSDKVSEQHRGRLEDGRELVVMERCAYDAAGQVNRVRWTFRLGEESWEGHLDMRCFFPLEIEALLHHNGWRIEEHHGAFDGSPFRSDSPKQIFVCTARD